MGAPTSAGAGELLPAIKQAWPGRAAILLGLHLARTSLILASWSDAIVWLFRNYFFLLPTQKLNMIITELALWLIHSTTSNVRLSVCLCLHRKPTSQWTGFDFF